MEMEDVPSAGCFTFYALHMEVAKMLNKTVSKLKSEHKLPELILTAPL